MSNLSWLIVEDFNEILLPDEKAGKERNNWQIDNFHDALSNTRLFDMGFEGPKFTWKGSKQGADYVRAYLDRRLISLFLKIFIL